MEKISNEIFEAAKYISDGVSSVLSILPSVELNEETKKEIYSSELLPQFLANALMVARFFRAIGEVGKVDIELLRNQKILLEYQENVTNDLKKLL